MSMSMPVPMLIDGMVQLTWPTSRDYLLCLFEVGAGNLDPRRTTAVPRASELAAELCIRRFANTSVDKVFDVTELLQDPLRLQHKSVAKIESCLPASWNQVLIQVV
ncbi:MAG: hypothetical protein L6R35_002699 [Caloplaca aegaea]|nr:MAG: hypothetical protein L6R35_002699 [Caloplaca aegaea]